jgi:hypothetical protein
VGEPEDLAVVVEVAALVADVVEVVPPAGWVPGAAVGDVVPMIVVVVVPVPPVRGTRVGALATGAGAVPGWMALGAIVQFALALPEIFSSTGVAAVVNMKTTQLVAV